MCSNIQYSNSTRVTVVILYVITMFITSDDSSLRIFSMTLYNFVAFGMIGLSLVSLLYSGKLTIKLVPELRCLYIILIWIVISLIASKVIESKNIMDEVYNYDWVSGVNSPTVRGLSFIIRYFLSLFVIHFIIHTINNTRKFSIVMKTFMYSFCLFTLFPILQLLMLSIFNIELGKIYYEGVSSRARIGSYVGEPSVLAGMLCCGVFPLLSAIKISNSIVRINRYVLRIGLGLAIIGLLFTSSASVIASMILSLILYVRKLIGNKTWLMLLTILITVTLLSTSFQNYIIFKIIRELSTINIRSLSWIVGFNSILDNPITGIGIGQAPFFVAPYLPSLSDIPFDINRNFNFMEGRYTPMNTYLEFTTETGVIGLLLLLFFIHDIYKYQKDKNNTYEQRYIQFAFGAGLLAIAIAMNSFPGGFYLGYLNFMIGMYIAGLKIYSTPAVTGILH